MNSLLRYIVAGALLVAALGARAAPVDAPRDVDHVSLDRLLRKYVNERGLVNYAAWKASAEDMQTLHDYLAQFDEPAPFADGHKKAASLINAYNALTLQWILDNYPTKSIKATSNPWGAKRHRVGGRLIALDEIEHDTLRPLLGYRVHATLVCAAKSCPPLRQGAYSADKLDGQLDDAMRRWLARRDLNLFMNKENTVRASLIFKWYAKDFDKGGGVKAVLANYAPEIHHDYLLGTYAFGYLPYNWDLNEQHAAGD